MRLIDLALFRLALAGKISVEQAKVLSVLNNNLPSGLEMISILSGLGKEETSQAVAGLLKTGLVCKNAGLFSVKGLFEKIAAIIDSESILCRSARKAAVPAAA